MSKQTAAKKARRKKRQSARNVRWLPDELQAEALGIARIAEEIGPRGWEYDDEFSGDEFITWYFPPSGVELAEDDVCEPVTRIWVSDPEQAQLVLVGTGEDGFVHGLTVDQLFANLDAIEAYRIGDTPPEF
jgi:hypothetical protein